MYESCIMRWEQNCLVAELSGEVDHHMAAAMRSVLDDEILDRGKGNGPVHLIFDFHHVTFMDSSGIGVVLGRYQKIRETGGRVCITGCDDYVKQILHMAGVFMIASYCGSLEEAITKCLGKAEEPWTKMQ